MHCCRVFLTKPAPEQPEHLLADITNMAAQQDASLTCYWGCSPLSWQRVRRMRNRVHVAGLVPDQP